jgi:hypothetical protein
MVAQSGERDHPRLIGAPFGAKTRHRTKQLVATACSALPARPMRPTDRSATLNIELALGRGPLDGAVSPTNFVRWRKFEPGAGRRTGGDRSCRCASIGARASAFSVRNYKPGEARQALQ